MEEATVAHTVTAIALRVVASCEDQWRPGFRARTVLGLPTVLYVTQVGGNNVVALITPHEAVAVLATLRDEAGQQRVQSAPPAGQTWVLAALAVRHRVWSLELQAPGAK